MNNDQRQRAQHILAGMHSTLKISLNVDSPFAERIHSVISSIQDISAKVLYDQVGEGSAETYYFRLSAAGKGTVSYHAFPEEMEFEPFLKTLVEFSAPRSSLTSDQLSALARVTQPVSIELAISQHCPHCGEMVLGVNTLAAACEFVRVDVVEVTLNEQFVLKHGITSTPAVIIDNKLVFVSRTELDQILNYITSGNAQDQLKKRILHLLESREEQLVLDELANHPDASPVICSLLTAPELSTRLAMLTLLEEMSEQEAPKVKEVVPFLIEQLQHPEIPIRCDVIMALALCKDQRALQPLLKLKDDSNEDVREGALEAIEEIESSTRGDD